MNKLGSWVAGWAREHRQSLLVFFAGLGLVFFQIGGFWSATWLSKWMFLIVLSLFAMSWWAAKKTSLFYLPLMLYAFASLLTLALYPQSPYRGVIDDVTLLALEKNALVGTLEVISLLLLFANVTKTCTAGISALFAAIWSLGTIATLLLPLHGNHSPPNNGLWFGNPSMGAGLLSCLLPFMWTTKVRVGGWNLLIPVTWFLNLWMIWRTGASVPWGVLGVVTAAYWLAQTTRKARFFSVLGVGFLGVGMIALGKIILGAEFWNQNGRSTVWRMSWDWFWHHAYPAIGFGYSSSQILLPIEQIMTQHFDGYYFLWLHNDWLQLGIEGGFMGMFCVFLALLRLLSVTAQRPVLFSSLVGFVILGLFNYPLRMPIHCFCLVLICGLGEALSTERPGVEMLLEWPRRFARYIPSWCRVSQSRL